MVIILYIYYMCIRIYLLMFACICFVWLCVAWLPLFSLCCMFGYYCSLEMFHMLIISIDSLTCFCLVTLLVVWLSCFPWHAYSHFCISHSSWHDWFYLLYIILFVSTYCPLCHIPILFILSLPSLCLDMSDIPVFCMTALLLCDVVCLYRSHIYPLTSNPLVSVISFISVLTFVSVSCVYLFLWPS